MSEGSQETSCSIRVLNSEEENNLQLQNGQLVSKFQAEKLEKEAKKNWDIFYKRNGARFFKDRHWTTREFEELTGQVMFKPESQITILEVGCGVGNFFYPLLEKGYNVFIYACDFSPRAIAIVKSHPLYDESKITAFQCDITSESLLKFIPLTGTDIVSLIFVLSAIHPDKFKVAVENLTGVLSPGGYVIFRDYGLYDAAQIRFKAGSKIADNLYVRQDGTRAYYFSCEEVNDLFTGCGLEPISCEYVHRRTINVKEGANYPRTFVQGKFRKPR